MRQRVKIHQEKEKPGRLMAEKVLQKKKRKGAEGGGGEEDEKHGGFRPSDRTAKTILGGNGGKENLNGGPHKERGPKKVIENETTPGGGTGGVLQKKQKIDVDSQGTWASTISTSCRAKGKGGEFGQGHLETDVEEKKLLMRNGKQGKSY